MDPLFNIKKATTGGLLPDDISSKIIERFDLVISGVDRIEKASGLNYPAAYVEPSVVVSSPDPGSFEYGIMFARTIPLEADGRLQVMIQISAPLVAFGLKGTIHAILAHEFLHFLQLVYRASKMRIVSDEISGSIFENVFNDDARTFEPRAVFDDRTLLSHITKKFPSGFRDYKLEDKTVKLWIKRGLPQTNVSLETNIARISPEVLSRVTIDGKLVSRLEEIDRRSERIRKRVHY